MVRCSGLCAFQLNRVGAMKSVVASFWISSDICPSPLYRGSEKVVHKFSGRAIAIRRVTANLPSHEHANVAKTRSKSFSPSWETGGPSHGSHEAGGFLFCEVNNEDRIEGHR